jgi:arylsulfatase A-like enzyme
VAALARAGYRTICVTDDGDAAVRAQTLGFGDLLRVAYEPAARAADTVEETQLFRLFAAVGDALANAAGDNVDGGGAPPFFLWAHARAMCGDWDAPYALRRRFVDEDDPDPPSEVRFEPRRLPADVDPDELLGLRAAYAGQILALDECLAALDDLLGETGLARRTVVALVGVRGYPLGEHGAFGLCDAPLHEELLHEELLHVPCILRLPGNRHATVRLPQLVHHADLPPTLLDVCGLAPGASAFDPALGGASLLPLIESERGPWRDRICHWRGDRQANTEVAVTEVAITTPAWRLRHVGERIELYVKPDDRWEVNDVASRCGDVAERLAAAMRETRDAFLRGEVPPPLDDVLRGGLS